MNPLQSKMLALRSLIPPHLREETEVMLACYSQGWSCQVRRRDRVVASSGFVDPLIAPGAADLAVDRCASAYGKILSTTAEAELATATTELERISKSLETYPGDLRDVH